MYSYEAIVRYSETGGNKISNMATIANYFQDCAILQSEEVGNEDSPDSRQTCGNRCNNSGRRQGMANGSSGSSHRYLFLR